MLIRKFEANDWGDLWRVLKPVFRAGEAYALPRDIDQSMAYEYWIDSAQACFIACNDDGALLGSYYLKPNQQGPGDHVCNCGYIVSDKASGKGLATALCIHSQQQARELGFEAMQFNLVVSNNYAAIRVWEKQGFATAGCLPGAFRHPRLGRIDAMVMYKQL